MFRAFFRVLAGGIKAIVRFVVEQTREFRVSVALPVVTVAAHVGWEAIECYAVGRDFECRFGIDFRIGWLHLGFWSIGFKAPFTYDGQKQRAALRQVFRIVAIDGPGVEALRRRAERRRRQARMAAKNSQAKNQRARKAS